MSAHCTDPSRHSPVATARCRQAVARSFWPDQLRVFGNIGDRAPRTFAADLPAHKSNDGDKGEGYAIDFGGLSGAVAPRGRRHVGAGTFLILTTAAIFVVSSLWVIFYEETRSAGITKIQPYISIP